MAKRVVILGAGPCGLWAARELIENPGIEVFIVEKEDRPGGLCRTHEKDGFRFDLGGHRFITSDPVLAGEVRDLMGESLLRPQRKSRILLGGKYYSYPVGMADLFRGGLRDNARMAAGFFRARWRRALKAPAGRDLASWLKGEYGDGIYDRFFRPYTAKVWGLPPERLSAAWAGSRIPGLRVRDVVSRRRGRSFAREYLYPEKGMGQLFDVLAQDLERNGVRFLFSSRITGLSPKGGRVSAVRCENGSVLPCDGVISTIPLPELAACLGVPCGAFKFRAIRFLNIMLDCAGVSDNTWIYVPEPRYLFARLQEPRKRSPQSAPPGKTSLMLEIPCDEGDATWTLPLADLFRRCRKDLAEMGFSGLMDRVIGYFDTFAECGYPVLPLGAESGRKEVLDGIRRIGNVVSCGRQGAFSYLFMDQAMAQGAAAARKVLDWKGVDDREIYGIGEGEGYVEGAAVT